MSLAKEVRFVLLVAVGVCAGLVLFAALSSAVFFWNQQQEKALAEARELRLLEEEYARHKQEAEEEQRRDEEYKVRLHAEKLWSEIVENVRKDESKRTFKEKMEEQPSYQKRLGEVGREKCRAEELVALERVVEGMEFTRRRGASLGLYSVLSNEDKLWLSRVEGRVSQLKGISRED